MDTACERNLDLEYFSSGQLSTTDDKKKKNLFKIYIKNVLSSWYYHEMSDEFIGPCKNFV